MPKCIRFVFSGLLLCLVGVFASQAVAADKINVLIIDGQHNHNWQAATPAVKDILLKTERFNVDVLTSPKAKSPKEAWASFKPDFAKYGVVLVNYHGEAWPEEVNQALEKYMENGGGLVFYHAALFSFKDWENWNKMMGLGWRDKNYGDRISVDNDGKVVRAPKGEGPGSGHGPAHAFEMTTRLPEDPIMKGFAAKWMRTVKDELYHGQRGPGQNMTILATAFSAKSGGGTDTNEPIVWTIPYGKGRVFATLLGHDVPATTAADSAALLARGCEWAATGEVTLPAPK